MTISCLVNKVEKGQITALQLVEQSLSKLEQYQSFNTTIVSFDEGAKKRASEIDANIVAGNQSGKLLGIPFLAKDNFLVKGGDTTAASNILRGFDTPYQATVIDKLEAEGAICIGKANLDAFAHGSSTENSDFGTTLNPHDPSRIPGGSSGGSAAAVALDIVPFALGTDTGGSIRQPASFCGVVGLKPSYGLVSRWGVVAMASSTDVIGPITKSVEDAALVLDVIAGKDLKDSTTIDRQKVYKLSQGKSKNYKVGVVKEFFGAGIAKDVETAMQDSINSLKKSGHEIVEVSIPSIAYALSVYYVVVPAEVSSNLGRYDGQRYGYFKQSATDLFDSYSGTRGVGFNSENKRRIMIGTYVLSSGYYDAYYKKAATVRTKLINEFKEAFSSVDFLVGPTAPTTAFKIGEHTQNPLEMYLSDIMTVAVNLVGLPAISVPCKISEGLPIGFQIIASMQKDRELLAFAQQFEKEGVI